MTLEEKKNYITTIHSHHQSQDKQLQTNNIISHVLNAENNE